MAGSGKRVVLIGSGNWGSAVATLIGQNAGRLGIFEDEIRMYVYEETIEHKGAERKLSEVINEEHENVKYLPGIKLPTNIVAVNDLSRAAEGADILVWVVPHQFVPRMVGPIKAVMNPDAISISLIKGGIDIKDGKMELCSDMIKEQLGTPTFVLMGANVANEVAQGDFCEATIGYSSGQEASATVLKQLFDTPTFSIEIIEDVPGVELCGALKNIVALGAGFSDGLGI